MRKHITVGIIVFMMIVLGCVPTKIWTSHPEIQTSGNAYYDIQFEPLKKDNNFFEFFLLTVSNRSDQDLEIDWNQTRYIYNGKLYGGFAFEGISPDDIKNSTIPCAVVPKGSRFSKEIAPIKLIAFVPLRDKRLSPDHSGISPGPLPAGENGIFLVIRQNGKEVREKIAVNIVSDEAN
jgi:hypothetical protein